jgi:hypothetical protein
VEFRRLEWAGSDLTAETFAGVAGEGSLSRRARRFRAPLAFRDRPERPAGDGSPRSRRDACPRAARVAARPRRGRGVREGRGAALAPPRAGGGPRRSPGARARGPRAARGRRAVVRRGCRATRDPAGGGTTPRLARPAAPGRSQRPERTRHIGKRAHRPRGSRAARAAAREAPRRRHRRSSAARAAASDVATPETRLSALRVDAPDPQLRRRCVAHDCRALCRAPGLSPHG